MIGNDRPKANADDAALWARLRVIGFGQSLEQEQCDPTVKIRMLNDPDVRSALLAWAMEGLRAYQAGGLPHCKASEAETAAYHDSQDAFSDFLTDCCELSNEFKTSAKDMRKCYEDWCAENGYRFPLTRKGLAEKLESRGCVSKRSTGGAFYWFGVKLVNSVNQISGFPLHENDMEKNTQSQFTDFTQFT